MARMIVPDMTCKHCVASITKVIQAADPAVELSFDLPTHAVEANSKLSDDEILSIVENAGFTPELAS